MRSSPRSLIALLVAVTLVAAACGADDAQPSTAEAETAATTAAGTESTAAEAAGDGAVSPVSSPLSGTHTLVDGTSIDLDQFAGQDVVLWFWAPW